jgi:hypothetical protein
LLVHEHDTDIEMVMRDHMADFCGDSLDDGVKVKLAGE